MHTSFSPFRIGTVPLANPIVIASCPATEDRERIVKCFDAGAAAAILKSCHPLHTPGLPAGARRFRHSVRGVWGTSTTGRELLSPQQASRLYTDLCQSNDHVVIPSIAGFSLDSREWIDTLRFFEPLQPPCVQLDLFYLNEDLSLPDTQARLGTLMMRLRENCTLPLLPKLNQELRPGAALATFEHTGIAGWSLLDSIRTHLPSHPQAGDSGFPVFAHAQGLGSASLFGGWQLPLVSEYVYRLHTKSSISIVAGGGVNQASDVFQLLALGAQAVQVATPVLVEGPAWIRRTLRDLETAAEIQADPVESAQTFDRVRAHIDLAQCSGCGRCAEQLMCNAIRMTARGPQVQQDRCEGCGFCLGLCANHAIYLSPPHRATQ